MNTEFTTLKEITARLRTITKHLWRIRKQIYRMIFHGPDHSVARIQNLTSQVGSVAVTSPAVVQTGRVTKRRRRHQPLYFNPYYSRKRRTTRTKLVSQTISILKSRKCSSGVIQQQNRSGSEETNSSTPDNSVGRCSICLEPYSKMKGVCATKCGHVFCTPCTSSFHEKSLNNCPNCKKPIKLNSIMQLYV